MPMYDFECLCCGRRIEEMAPSRTKPIPCECGGPMVAQFPAPALGLYFSSYNPREMSTKSARMEREMEGFSE